MGWAGRRHVEAIRELGPEVCVACVADSDAEHLARTADELGVAGRFTDYRSVLDDSTVDAVSICTPHSLHHTIALDAASAGKHILCEKPLALTVDDGRVMLRAANQHGVKLYVAESAAYTDEALCLRALLAGDSAVGSPVFAKLFHGFHTNRYGYPGRREWLGRTDLGGTGTWMLHGIHLVGQARFVLGEVRSVYMVERRTEAFETQEVEGSVCGTLVMESSVPLFVVQSCENRMPANTGGWTVFGNKGTLRASGEGIEIFDADGTMIETGQGVESRGRIPEPPDQYSPFAREIAAFRRFVDGSEGPTDGMSELRSLAVIEAGYDSIQTGLPIVLAERYPDLFQPTES